MTIDTVAGGALMNKPSPGECTLIKDMAQNHYQWVTKRTLVEKKETKGEPPKENVVTTPEEQKDEPVEFEKQRKKDIKDKEAMNDSQENQTYVPPPPYIPLIPYLQRFKQTKQDTQYKKFMKLDDPKPLECNVIAENKFAKKQKDHESFSIPCILGRHVIDKALLDLGASVSLMPLAVCKRLDLGDMQPTRMSLQLPDRPVKYPIGILEHIPVRIGQLYIHTVFIVMDIKEDKEIPILLGRLFLSTAGAMINVKRGRMTFEVGDEKVEFILSKFLKVPTMDDSCCEIDIIDECIRELDKEEHIETIKLPSTPITEDDGFKSVTPYIDDSLNECLVLTRDHMPSIKKPIIELKELRT
ncbi:uncharacterized protein LOC127099736 [Lathyrus oleraceus]|uniref:uncharacterized protein LOC127099736 n=1 Tax=Pisum sativum TaxID=3888 RepID=UPI0021D1847D|nr:uncharacterized protein LOC127099736 [Pisum sativum]